MRWPKRVPASPPTLGRIVHYVAPWRRRWALLLLVVVLYSLVALLPALLVRDFVNAAGRPAAHFGYLAELVAAGLGATIAAGLLGVARTYVAVGIAQAAVAQLRQDVFARLVRQSIGFHTRSRAGELTSRLFNDVGDIDSLLSNAVGNLVSSGVTAVAAAAVMLALDWKLSIAALALFPVVAIGYRLASRTVFHKRAAVQRQLAELTAFAQENLGLSAMMLIRSFGREPLVQERFETLNEELRRREVSMKLTTSWLLFASSVILMLAPAVLVLIGAYLLSRHQLSLGTLLAFAALATGVFGPAMHGLASGAGSAMGSAALWSRVFEVLDAEPEIRELPAAEPLRADAAAVEFDALTFTYPGQTRPALEDISLTIAPGQLVALVGPSGAGKTTLTSLLARFVDPQSGSVRIGGVDLREVTLASLSDAVGVVFQDNFLFHASIAENLRLGRPDATEEQLRRAAAEAFLEDFIDELPDGYATVVGERGHRLSGGEKQRVAIARAILKDPPILILDEATSHLDSASEQMVQRALGGLFRHRTSLVIAHRLSTILTADLIVVLDRGRIVEQGTHAELIGRGGLYAQLHELQFRSQVAAARP